ncbi:MAG: hypothetical protein IJS28_11630 [Synergistaceae bacterium]|nr:hypothetical protein [Synergistaceae bacterium]
MKKILAAVIVLLLSCCASAEETASQDVAENNIAGYTIQRDMGNATGFRTLDGLHVVWRGTYRVKPPEPNPESPDAEIKPDEGMFTVFMVKSDRDTSLKLDILDGVDIRTNKFSYRSGDWGYIADSLANGNPRDIPAGFWVRVTFWHNLPFKYGERPLIARLGFVINGYEITLKRFRPETWGDWTYAEREYVLPLEEDRKRSESEEIEVRHVKR